MGMKTCILCIKKPFFYIGSFVGFFPYSFSCSHKSNGIDYKFNFSHTKVAGCLILLIIRFLYFCEFIFSENRPHHVQFVNIIVTTLCFLYQVFSLYTSRIKLLSLKCLLQASKSKNDEILNKFQSGKLQRTSLYHILCALVQLSLGVVYLGIGYKAQLQRIIDCFDMYIFVTSQADIHMDIFVFCAIFDAFYKRIRFFNERSNWKHKKNSIGPKIISFLKFYKILFHSFQLASLYSSPLLIVSILIIIIYQVYYCTINIGSILYKSELNVSLEYGLSLCITYTLTVSSFIPVVKLESINTQCQDITSVLFRYPISKLNKEDAAQIEMLIKALQTKQPILKPYDIFVVGSKLTASITGAIITYVMVALQFQAFWARHN